jgi:hypothetical protein
VIKRKEMRQGGQIMVKLPLCVDNLQQNLSA